MDIQTIEPIDLDDRSRAEERRKQLRDYIAGRVIFRGQRELTREEADAALANLAQSLGTPGMRR